MEIIGHLEQIRNLWRMADSGHIPHSLLLVGPSHIGKKKVALDWVKYLYKKEVENHPDFLFVSPEKGEIGLGEIDKIRQHLLLYAHSAPWKVVLIDDAHLMNTVAQNSFLKTLEEPRGNTLIILISSHPFLLLPTILSRVQKMSFNLVSSSEMKKQFSSADDDMIRRGAPGLLLDKKFVAERKKMRDELIKIKEMDIKKRFEEAKKISARDNVEEILNEWLLVFREKMLLEEEKKSSCRSIKKIQETINLISRRVNTKLALEALMIEI